MGDVSILNSTKKAIGVSADYDVFDADLVMFINGVFSTLNDLGLGPNAGFAIDDATTMWSDYLGNDQRLNSVKTYMYLRVRLLFDPPQSSYLMDAMKEQIKELEWRINVLRENVVNPTLVRVDPVVDGGGTGTDVFADYGYDGGTA